MSTPDDDLGPATDPLDDPIFDPAAVTEEREFREPPLNHLSPMGQVEAIGRFAQGAGGDRLRKWFQIVIPVLIVALLAAVVFG
jgi:hypothetical protein